MIWYFIGYFLAYFLGSARGEIHERNREERAVKKVENRTVNLKDYRK